MRKFTVTTKGRVVIPAEIRKRHEIKKGTKICFSENGPDIILRPVTRRTIEAMRGSLKTHGNLLKALMEEKKVERTL